ncbi:MAG: thrombospondin type 3 repeat-containing protein [Deltaproteobacteria bacterium]
MKLQIRLFTMLFGVLLLPGLSSAGEYRDKHGNVGDLELFSPLVHNSPNAIDYTVPYLSTDSEGVRSGEYRITSEMNLGRGLTPDFVLNVRVIDDTAGKGAELVIRNHPTTAPRAPILRLLTCPPGAPACNAIEDKRIENDTWGVWVIQDRSDIETYPIELLDARAILQLLDATQLAALPDNATGNWSEIMENHRTNFEQAKFRGDIDNLGNAQNQLLTQRLIEEISVLRPASSAPPLSLVNDYPSGMMVYHSANIIHNALTFMTGHKELIEDMTTVLFKSGQNNSGIYLAWPLNVTFPFGRMPIWLLNQNPPSSSSPQFHYPLPVGWNLGIPAGSVNSVLDTPGCFHPWPSNGEVPNTPDVDPNDPNLHADNLGRFECDVIPTANGFGDRPCTLPTDYTAVGTGVGSSIRSTIESGWHNGIHGYMGGDFLSSVTTAGTAVFWTFHTYASSHTYANWIHAQKRDMPLPVSNIDTAAFIDVYFLVDLSGSYSNDLPTFKIEVPDLIDDLDAQFSAIHFGLARFEDYPIAPFGDAPSGDKAYEQLVDLTATATDVKNAIAGLSVRYGADFQESQLTALYQSATGLGQIFAAPNQVADIPAGQNASFRNGAVKIIILFTDADFHLPGDPGSGGGIPYPGASFADTVAAILALDPPMVIGVSSGGGGITDLRQMARATGALAPAGGADCDGDGDNEVLAGDPLVCTTGIASEGIGAALAGVIKAAVDEAWAKDSDDDGQLDLKDNCPTITNRLQEDSDGDRIGDACDPDDDNDGIADQNDNCLLLSNNDQRDSDEDGIGDICDDDDDGDGVPDSEDACPFLSTPNVIVGTARNDRLRGTPENDMIFGLGGNDRIDGLGGDDCLVGGAGKDRIRGGPGDDILLGGPGKDSLYGEKGRDTLFGGDDRDRLDGGDGDDFLDGGPGRDKLIGRNSANDGSDTMEGGEGDDTLIGGAADDFLHGGPGNDRIIGKDGNDHLDGGAGNDYLIGGRGNDTLQGGPGLDRLKAGAGDDFLGGGHGQDLLVGGSGNDRMDGGGGGPHSGLEDAGVDTCIGGGGKDTAVHCEKVSSVP